MTQLRYFISRLKQLTGTDVFVGIVALIIVIALVLAFVVGVWLFSGFVVLWMVDFGLRAFNLEYNVPLTWQASITVGFFIALISGIFIKEK
jgi:hypothetical protein